MQIAYYSSLSLTRCSTLFYAFYFSLIEKARSVSWNEKKVKRRVFMEIEEDAHNWKEEVRYLSYFSFSSFVISKATHNHMFFSLLSIASWSSDAFFRSIIEFIHSTAHAKRFSRTQIANSMKCVIYDAAERKREFFFLLLYCLFPIAMALTTYHFMLAYINVYHKKVSNFIQWIFFI